MIDDLFISEDKFADFFAYTKNPPTKEQAGGIGALYHVIRQSDPALICEGASWMEEWRRQPPAPERTMLRPDSPFDFHISPNFTYGEVTLYEEARRFTNQGQCEIANLICQFLELVRERFGPMKITSGHRPPEINRACGGAANSEHLFQPGCGALDVYPMNGHDIEFENWIDANWPYSVGYGMRSGRGFTHVGVREGDPHPRVRWNY